MYDFGTVKRTRLIIQNTMVDNREILELRHNVSGELYTSLYTGFVDMVYAMHEVYAGGFPQGKCGQIAEQIQKQCGGELVSGWLDYGTGRRQHWWLEIENNIVDPMAEEFNTHTPCRHIEVHRNIEERYWI